LGCALSLVVFALPLVESWHAATVRHIACPRDGELTDVDDAATPAPARELASPGQGRFIVASKTPGGRPGEDFKHEHCAIAQQSHVRFRQAAPVRISSRVVEERLAAPSAPERPRLRSAPLYRLAPKASPPKV
jgi:hypothetical protein